ncbi:unnamed protein product [Clonostachys chloroleuca]|uniref:UBC core domain-containing protein n=1 Tax=Clonostachys chloroleuca TaxID=1926264 RepID=A0AA35Q4E9_9HYPO|nr:unnamed protein product [Clonostachys chloroleuca]
MAPVNPQILTSFRKQRLQSEFAGLKQACPEGVFVSLTPTDPTIWSAILFVRDGPYAPAVLRFHISFPLSYPEMPPVVSFATDIFHPLITPLTTNMYTHDLQSTGAVSATDDERLPLGGFSLRHGFPVWFSRGEKATPEATGEYPGGRSVHASPPRVPELGTSQSAERYPSVYDILKYIRSTFDDGDVLDSVPIEAAGNPGAWHAWRTHRRKSSRSAQSSTGDPVLQDDGTKPPPDPAADSGNDSSGTRAPGEWNWDGVWEDRVRKGIATCLSEAALYGGSNTVPEDLINFVPMDEPEIETVKENIMRVLGSPD